jgi:hypothetical protein
MITSHMLAYIGPGAGLGLMTALGSLLLSVGLALLLVLAWPLRAVIKRMKGQKRVANSE